MLHKLYPVLRPLLFKLPPERAHTIALSSLQSAHRLHLLDRLPDAESAATTLMGLRFPNRVGLAAGFDKNARFIDAIGALGFGFVEIGTVTPRPQSGQVLPRVFRLPTHQALINRMGFPNDGIDAVMPRLARRTFPGVLGVNIGKNATTPIERAIDDYVTCYRALAPHADYVAVNVSSPNTQGLRQLQQVEYLRPILAALQEEGHRLKTTKMRHTPLLAKIAPDLTIDELQGVARLLVEMKIDGVIATNTTISRPSTVEGSESGGLSGAPLFELAQKTIRILKAEVKDSLAIIGAGGIMSGSNAQQSLRAGADLVQVYSGLIYRGPGLVRELRSAVES